MIYLPPSLPVAVVDDNEADRFLAGVVLEASQLANPLLEFASGEELLDYMKRVRAGEALAPALVLLDINMPGFSGFQVLEQIRSQERFRTLPVVTMLTSSDAGDDVDVSYALGANAFFQKGRSYGDFVASFDETFTNTEPEAAG